MYISVLFIYSLQIFEYDSLWYNCSIVIIFFIFLVFPCFILLFVLVICAFFNTCTFLMELSLLIKNLNLYWLWKEYFISKISVNRITKKMQIAMLYNKDIHNNARIIPSIFILRQYLNKAESLPVITVGIKKLIISILIMTSLV